MATITITKLIYSYSLNDLAHVEQDETVPSGYVVMAEKMDSKDALKFINMMHMKYVKGRVKGRFPSFEVIMLELDLFVTLKEYRRKLV